MPLVEQYPELSFAWNDALSSLREEAAQKQYEGCLVSEEIMQSLTDMNEQQQDGQRLNLIRQQLADLKPRTDFPYIQPNGLDEIRQQRPEGPRQLNLDLSQAELLDKFHGAWTGRAAGCALGKPVELMGILGQKAGKGRARIKTYLQARQQWPLQDYFSGESSDNSDLTIMCAQSWRENIAYMEPDDDIHYSLIALHILEQVGADFGWQDVADAWNTCLPYSAICTAETQAILNYNLCVPRLRRHNNHATPEFTRSFNNPYREWIGAQIRADGWAYCCAGNPELAAEFAWRDAHWTHTANGIYGEMFMAAMIAAAFVEADPKRLVAIGLSEIPRNCKLAEAVNESLEWISQCPTFEDFMQRLDDKYVEMSGVHTINNALVVVMSLFYGDMNPDQTIATSVMAGLDTDCNGATVGSIVGINSGQKNFGGVLKAPLNDTIKPLVFGFQEITMEELAQRTLKVHQKINATAD